MFLLKRMPKTHINHFWNLCQMSSARRESRARSSHVQRKKLPHDLARGQREFSFDEDASFFLQFAEAFRQNPNMMTEIFIFLPKKLPKCLVGHVECSFNIPAELLPDVHNPSRNFHCSKNIVPLIAKTLSGWSSALTNQQNFFTKSGILSSKVPKWWIFQANRPNRFCL